MAETVNCWVDFGAIAGAVVTIELGDWPDEDTVVERVVEQLQGLTLADCYVRVDAERPARIMTVPTGEFAVQASELRLPEYLEH